MQQPRSTLKRKEMTPGEGVSSIFRGCLSGDLRTSPEIAMADTLTRSRERADSAAAVSVETRFDGIPASSQITETTSDADSRDASPILGPLQGKPRLTLSAFRRPEQTIRLTKSDPRRKLGDDYNLHAPDCGILGHGAFSTVRLAVRKSDKAKVAVKTIAKHEALRSRRLRVGGRQYMEEWEILRRLKNHPYIISLLDVFETDEEIQLVMEYCPGGELFDEVQRRRKRARRGQLFSESEAARITSQILRALVDIHALGIVHRDVKAENILLTRDGDNLKVKLCDFGMARALCAESESLSDGESSPTTPTLSRSYSIVGSNYYMAPEAATGESYCTSMDMYSLGVTLYILLCGFPPVFSGSEGQSDVMFPSCYWKDVSEEAKYFVQSLLNPDSSTRPSARTALKDPWIIKTIFSPTKSIPVLEETNHVNLELVRQSLYKNISRRSVVQTSSRPRKRPRRTSTCLIALADLYRGVAATPQTLEADPVQTLKSGASFSDVEEERRASLTSPSVALSF